MFGRLIWTTLLAAAGYIAWRMLRGDQHPPVMHQPIRPQPSAPPAAVQPPAVATPTPAPIADTTPPAASTAAVAEAPASGAPGDSSEAGVAEAAPAADTGVEIEAYCMRCRTRRMIGGARPEITANGRHGMRGACTVCGTNVFTFVKEK